MAQTVQKKINTLKTESNFGSYIWMFMTCLYSCFVFHPLSAAVILFTVISDYLTAKVVDRFLQIKCG